MRFFSSVSKAIGIVVIILIMGAGVSYWYLLQRVDSAHGRVTEDISFSIQSGEGVVALAERLQTSGLIDGRLTFIAYAIKTNQYRQFQVGEYRLSGTLSIPEIINRFVVGKVMPAGVRVTFPEGWTMSQMAERLTASGLAGADFLAIAEKPFPKWRERYPFLQDLPTGGSLEGYLFPDTYIFPIQATGELVVNELLNNFSEKAAPTITQGRVARKLSFHEVMTLSSIIEEEGRTKEDRQNISDVFRKRLAIGQPLQSDATINYIHGTAKDQPTLKDLEADSPYNTYTHGGLPPGPIGNPGLVSIAAALSPTANPYFYFLIDPETRITYFAEDFEGHQRNRAAHGL